MSLHIHILFILSLLPAIAIAQQPVELPDELRVVLDNYEKHWGNKDAAGLSSLFTSDGFILRPGHPPVQGRENIQKSYEGSGGPLSLHAFDYEISGDLAIIIGGYTDAAGNLDRGKFTLTLKKTDGTWLIHSDMDNGNRR